MTVYVVGDIQGCLEPLQALLQRVNFQPGKDILWATGDLVNRGPHSLETLRFCHNLGDSFRTVLGNHDLHLIACARRACTPKNKDTLQEILNAPDCERLIDWLRQQPLMFTEHGFTVVHAGIPAQWSLEKAQNLADEVSCVLQSSRGDRFLQNMYGDQPSLWHDSLQGVKRWRLITNYFTRMRFCDAQGQLNLKAKEEPDNAPPGMAPWFHFRDCAAAEEQIIFGHWATLGGRYVGPRLFPLDTGCVWGGRLRLMRLDTQAFYHHPC